MSLVDDENLARTDVRTNKEARHDLEQPARRGRVDEWVGEIHDRDLPGLEASLGLGALLRVEQGRQERHALLEARDLYRSERFLAHSEECHEFVIREIFTQVSQYGLFERVSTRIVPRAGDMRSPRPLEYKEEPTRMIRRPSSTRMLEHLVHSYQRARALR